MVEKRRVKNVRSAQILRWRKQAKRAPHFGARKWAFVAKMHSKNLLAADVRRGVHTRETQKTFDVPLQGSWRIDEAQQNFK
jgi:hypothetical protein